MNWLSQRHRSAWQRDDRACEPLDREIDDELMFHFRTLVDEHLEAGMPAEEAWREAERRFGPVAVHREACRQVHSDQSNTVGLLALAVVLLIGLLGWSFREVRQLRNERDAAIIAAVEVEGTAENELKGRVLDAAGQPIAGSNVLVIVKSWPGGGYRQRAFSTHSDLRGNFNLLYRIPARGRYAVQVAALKNGYAFASTYHLKQDAREPLDDITLQLPSAAPLTLLVQDQQGRPLPGVRVVPSSRISASGRSHMIYFQGSEPAQVSADGAGRVQLGYFEWGDQAEVYVQTPGHEWTLHTIGIPESGQEAIVSIAASDP